MTQRTRGLAGLMMAGCALEFIKFILNKLVIGLDDYLMAACTFYRSMLAIQFKSCFIVVEFFYGPTIKTMTFGAVRSAFDFKLLVVGFFVALAAGSRQTGEFPVLIRFIRHVTGTAGFFLVRPFQGKCGFAVVESVVLPTGGQVALFAGFIRVPFFVDLSAVNVFMAIHTPLAQAPEFPFFFLLVAGKTRSCHMRPIQGKFGFGVLFQCISAFGKPVDVMARRAIGGQD